MRSFVGASTLLSCFAADVPSVRLNNGIDMPILSFGAQVWDDETCKDATTAALQAGFRMIWSSALIGSSCQAAQWEAIQASSVALDDVFVGGTVNSASCSGLDDCYSQTKSGAEEQFQILAKKPLDMLMLDYPSRDTDCDGVLGQWKAFEELYADKSVRTIAVSNFSPKQLECLAANASATVPSVNQMPYSIGHGKDTVVDDDAKFGVVVQAYSPLSRASPSDADLTQIGAAHNKTFAQVALRWIVQRNVTINTQSTKLSHFQEDVAIFDFELSDDEMDLLTAKSAQIVLFL
jgi:diketogulonate reductase-like aldo/keto reductase